MTYPFVVRVTQETLDAEEKKHADNKAKSKAERDQAKLDKKATKARVEYYRQRWKRPTTWQRQRKRQ